MLAYSRRDSSGWHLLKDETGKQFGELYCLGLHEVREEGKLKQRRAYFDCLCSCGKFVIVRGSSLRFGFIVSCGHLRESRAREMGQNNAGRVGPNKGKHWSAKQRARMSAGRKRAGNKPWSALRRARYEFRRNQRQGKANGKSS